GHRRIWSRDRRARAARDRAVEHHAKISRGEEKEARSHSRARLAHSRLSFAPQMPHTGPILEGKGDTDYERYVRVPELLELQKPVEALSNPEERLFQTTHQAAELWLHHVDYEIGRVVTAIEGDAPDVAAELLDRCRRILDLLREQIVILETMAPADY